MTPICLLGLFCQQSFVWVVCPQALLVTFAGQSQRGYDSLGAAGYPDLIVALLYYPVVGWILSRASREGRLRRVSVRAAIWHIAAIGLAPGCARIRNRIWGVG